ncbi:TRAP transporter small permease [Roseibacillus persicicus]|uniref:C4-dicarboxylate ABC transporter permease n=1 Tax=Roseibacillus persicicus TaxID=454148 RepID=A0A918U210_9BACT|nr:TRAP transporter small permease [Roseibacillus persicicus]MDQ8188929.1 TRAP transporter small permease [Roseibacillus persicicus]GHC66833.1 C4-dicarboxylate ABC transporter permease [Roseibacillus persicicus]
MNLQTLDNSLQKGLRHLLVALMAAMALDVLWQIFTRFFVGDPSVWTEELARFILIWLGCLGAAFGVGEGFHLRMDYFLQKTRPAHRAQLERLIPAFVLLIALSVFVFGGARLAYLAHELKQTSPALGIGMIWVYAVIPASGLIMVISCLQQMTSPHSHPETVTD